MEIRIKNQLKGTVDFCIGMHKYQLEPEQDVIAPVSDGDCMYLDQLVSESKQSPAEVALNSIIMVMVEAKKDKWRPSNTLLWIRVIVDAYKADKAGDTDY